MKTGIVDKPSRVQYFYPVLSDETLDINTVRWWDISLFESQQLVQCVMDILLNGAQKCNDHCSDNWAKKIFVAENKSY